MPKAHGKRTRREQVLWPSPSLARPASQPGTLHYATCLSINGFLHREGPAFAKHTHIRINYLALNVPRVMGMNKRHSIRRQNVTGGFLFLPAFLVEILKDREPWQRVKPRSQNGGISLLLLCYGPLSPYKVPGIQVKSIPGPVFGLPPGQHAAEGFLWGCTLIWCHSNLFGI